MAENIIDGSGISIQTYSDIVNAIVNGSMTVPGLVQIYGSDINVGSNTPDGNLVNIFALSKLDVLNLCVAIYDSFDPDQAVGMALDSISQLCGITRMGGSYTVTPIVVTATQAVNLVGLDNPAATPFTISDATDNQFNLLVSQTIASSGSYTYNFQSAEMGYIQVTPNTITNIITITPGIATVNNPTAPTTVGVDQETDSAMRLRRQQSISIPSQGAMNGLIGGLESVYGISQVIVNQNSSGTTSTMGIPAYSIWVVCDGGASGSIGQVIYDYWFPGIGMYGTTTVPITQIDGSIINMYYDTTVYENFYTKFDCHSKTSSSINSSAIASYLATNCVLGIYKPADITYLASLLKTYSTDLIMSGAGVSLSAGAYTSMVWPSGYKNKLILPAGNVAINII